MGTRLTARYRVRAEAGAIEQRAREIAVEQSVEMPVSAIRDAFVLSEVVGEVTRIDDGGAGWFEVDIALAISTISGDGGQLLNMLYGNTSLHDDVVLADFGAPPDLLRQFSGPNQGLEGLRKISRAPGRALTCSALKPQGLPAEALAEIAYEFALGGVDFIKDDHGLANQDFSPFEARLRACARQIRRAAEITGRRTQYVPSLFGHFGQMQKQIEIARDEGLSAVMIAPMIAGASTFQALSAAHPDFAFFAHPTLAGASRISPVALARLFRLLGADAAIFPNHGGRFGYSPEACRRLSDALREPWADKRSSAPTPAGGMNLSRVPEILRFYGPDTILLIGGALLAAPLDALAAETATFVKGVVNHDFGASLD
jgi:ribulose-bisphosphate carboxylase large chain